jgi:toxin ParE1/3/4
MPAFHFAPPASADLDEISDYIAEDNPEAAGRFVEDITNTCRTLAAFPMSGRARDELLENMRSFPVGNYVIFYDVIPDGVEILRVLHGARDFPAIFKS